MNFRNLIVVSVLIITASLAFADTQNTTLTWVVPASVSHSLSYGGSCSTSAMYFNESNALQGASPVNGDANKILPYNLSTGGSACQSSSSAAITVTNGGNVNLDVGYT